VNAAPSYSSESGAAAVEFAVSSLVLFMLVFGSIGVSMAYYTYEVINQYARDATRFAIVHGNGCSIPPGGTSCSIGTGATANTALKTYLNHQIFPGINGANLTIGTTYAHGPATTTCSIAACNGSGDQVTVTISYPYLYNLPFVPQRSFTMHGSSTMVISQ
jgi:Flp pilus assembly protein TadG